MALQSIGTQQSIQVQSVGTQQSIEVQLPAASEVLANLAVVAKLAVAIVGIAATVK